MAWTRRSVGNLPRRAAGLRDNPDRHHGRVSIVGTNHDLEDVFWLPARGRTRVLYETRPLEDVNEAFAEVESASTKASRVVLRPDVVRRSRDRTHSGGVRSGVPRPPL